MPPFDDPRHAVVVASAIRRDSRSSPSQLLVCRNDSRPYLYKGTSPRLSRQYLGLFVCPWCLLFPIYVNLRHLRGKRTRIARSKAIVQVRDARELEQEIGKLLADPAARRVLGERARDVVERNKGAVAATVRMIEAMI